MALFARNAGRVTAFAAAASLTIVGATLPASASSDGTSGATIDTYSAWDGSSAVAPFGNPDSSTYGETITVPAGMKHVKWFTFYMGGITGDGMIFRGEIYGWDGTKATNPVWESKPRHFDSTPAYQAVKFKAKKAKVKAGEQYVLFASVSKDCEQTAPGVVTQWGSTGTDVYSGGQVVFLNDSGDESKWTTQPWSPIGNIDFALKAKLT